MRTQHPSHSSDRRRTGSSLRDGALYALFHLPSWGAALLVVWLGSLVGLPVWFLAIPAAAWILKDLVGYRWLRPYFVPTSEPEGTRSLVGRQAEVTAPLAPLGTVRLGGELWRAECVAASGPVPRGQQVIVEATRGLTLLVRADGGE